MSARRTCRNLKIFVRPVVVLALLCLSSSFATGSRPFVDLILACFVVTNNNRFRYLYPLSYRLSVCNSLNLQNNR